MAVLRRRFPPVRPMSSSRRERWRRRLRPKPFQRRGRSRRPPGTAKSRALHCALGGFPAQRGHSETGVTTIAAGAAPPMLVKQRHEPLRPSPAREVNTRYMYGAVLTRKLDGSYSFTSRRCGRPSRSRCVLLGHARSSLMRSSRARTSTPSGRRAAVVVDSHRLGREGEGLCDSPSTPTIRCAC